MSSMNGQFILPKFKTTQEQLNSFIPYIEYNYGGSKVKGFTWRIVKQADTSTTVPQENKISVNIEFHKINGENIYDENVSIFDAYRAPYGEVIFNNAVEASEIGKAVVCIWTEDESTNYGWIFDATSTNGITSNTANDSGGGCSHFRLSSFLVIAIFFKKRYNANY